MLQAEAAAEAKLKGPHPFPLERLLATFWELRNAQDKEPASMDEQRDAQSGDLFMQISSLVSQRFLSQVSTAPCLLRISLHRSQGLASYSANLARSTSLIGSSAEERDPTLATVLLHFCVNRV